MSNCRQIARLPLRTRLARRPKWRIRMKPVGTACRTEFSLSDAPEPCLKNSNSHPPRSVLIHSTIETHYASAGCTFNKHVLRGHLLAIIAIRLQVPILERWRTSDSSVSMAIQSSDPGSLLHACVGGWIRLLDLCRGPATERWNADSTMDRGLGKKAVDGGSIRSGRHVRHAGVATCAPR